MSCPIPIRFEPLAHDILLLNKKRPTLTGVFSGGGAFPFLSNGHNLVTGDISTDFPFQFFRDQFDSYGCAYTNSRTYLL